jgi:hypothetical protein
MRRTAVVILASVVGALAGCVTPEGERQRALDFATKRCDSMGKQVLVRNTEQTGVPNLTRYETVVEFACVGPGDDGYVPPS